jgi:hypothetical protein
LWLEPICGKRSQLLARDVLQFVAESLQGRAVDRLDPTIQAEGHDTVEARFDDAAHQCVGAPQL